MIQKLLIALFISPLFICISTSQEKSDTSITMNESGFLLKSELDLGGVNSSGVVLSVGAESFGSGTSFSGSYSFFIEQSPFNKTPDHASIFTFNYGYFTQDWTWAKVGLSYAMGTKYVYDFDLDTDVKSNYAKVAITLDVGHSWQLSRITRIGWNLSVGVGNKYLLAGLGVIFQFNNPF